MDYKKIFDECCLEYKENCSSKLKDRNNFRVSADDVVKTVHSYPVHKAIFDACYKEGQFKTLRSLWKIFGDIPLFRINQFKDLSIIAPLLYVTDSDDDLGLDRGDLVIPICKLLPFSELAEESKFPCICSWRL